MGVVAFSSIGLPGLNGFTGEVLSVMGMFATNKLYATLGLTGIILGAWYTLWLVQRTFFGRLREPVAEGHGAEHAHVSDLNVRELAALAPIMVMIFWIGLYPEYFTRRMEPSVQRVVFRLHRSRPPEFGGLNQPASQLAAQGEPAAPHVAAQE
jgi:NADH-quinone oxidoreductase subunit M